MVRGIADQQPAQGEGRRLRQLGGHGIERESGGHAFGRKPVADHREGCGRERHFARSHKGPRASKARQAHRKAGGDHRARPDGRPHSHHPAALETIHRPAERHAKQHIGHRESGAQRQPHLHIGQGEIALHGGREHGNDVAIHQRDDIEHQQHSDHPPHRKRRDPAACARLPLHHFRFRAVFDRFESTRDSRRV